MREPPGPAKEVAALAHHSEARPEQIIATDSTRSDAIVQPGDVAEWVRRASLHDQFRALDPLGMTGWLQCPVCRQRSIGIADAVVAWCASCGSDWTRWSVGRRVLSSPAACRRIAAMLLAEHEAVA